MLTPNPNECNSTLSSVTGGTYPHHIKLIHLFRGHALEKLRLQCVYCACSNTTALTGTQNGGELGKKLAARYRNAPDEFLYTGEDEKPPSYTH